jgi:hypothetical protein
MDAMPRSEEAGTEVGVAEAPDARPDTITSAQAYVEPSLPVAIT